MELKNVSLVLVFAFALFCFRPTISGDSTPKPTPWPEQFHALLYMNLSKGNLQMSDLWYDWPKGRNVNIFQKQLGVILYDIEWDNGTSFFYTSGERDGESCTTMEFGVGLPRPDFMMDGAEYLGTEVVDGGFLCNVWEKGEFIWYYEDVVSKRPVRWDFYDGISSHVMTFEEGATLQDSVTQAPAYCFDQDDQLKAAHHRFMDGLDIVNPVVGKSDQRSRRPTDGSLVDV